VRSLTTVPSNSAAVASPARVKKFTIAVIGSVEINQGITFSLCAKNAIFQSATVLKTGSFIPVSRCGKITTRQLLNGDYGWGMPCYTKA